MVHNEDNRENASSQSAWLSRRWKDLTFIGFDTETTGKYPLEAEICEIAAVKWQDGRVVDTFSSLIKPSKPMGAEVIAIHGITNEMVVDAPRMSDKIADFHAFLAGGVAVAHHAPFDLGFIAIEFEKAGLPLPDEPALCSSLLSRRLFPESENHRLQTLIKFFSLEQGAAHRALDDAKACLEVGLRCLAKTGEEAALSEAANVQGGLLSWSRFSMRALESEAVKKNLIFAIREKKAVELVYNSGSKPGKKRSVYPHGLVRSLDGDFLVAYESPGQKSKRYFLADVASVDVIHLS